MAAFNINKTLNVINLLSDFFLQFVFKELMPS